MKTSGFIANAVLGYTTPGRVIEYDNGKSAMQLGGPSSAALAGQASLGAPFALRGLAPQVAAPSIQLLANRSLSLQTRAGELTRVDIFDGLTGLTQQGNRVAAGIRSGDLGLNALGDDLFERAFRLKGGTGQTPQAFAYGEQIFVRRNAQNILSEVVHEGTHGLDYLRGFNGSVLQLENRSFFFARQFQRAGGGSVEFDTINQMQQFIRDRY
jgi:hypothetical protein